ncbi:hypothetical protein MASR1M45_10900 [Candidatus Kapaibacterium sp.]
MINTWLKMKLFIIYFAFFFGYGNLYSQLIPVNKGENIGYIDTEGNPVLPFDFSTTIEYYEIEYDKRKFKAIRFPEEAYFSEGYASVQKKEYFWFIPIKSSYVLIDTSGKVVINSSTRKLGRHGSGLIPITVQNKIIDMYVEYYTYCDINGIIAIDDYFDYTGPFDSGLAIVMQNKKYFHIDKSGYSLSDMEFELAEKFSESYASVMVDSLWGFINLEGKISIEPQYQLAGMFKNGLARVMKNKKYGYIDYKNNIIIDFIYESANDFNEGLASVMDGSGLWGFIDKSGKFAIKASYYSAGNFNQGLAPVNIDGKFGFINNNGNIVIEPIYDYAKEFRNGIAEVWKNDKMHYINISGNTIWTFETK